MTDCVWRVPLGQKEPKSQKHLLLLSDMGVETHHQFTLFHFQLRHFNYRTKTPGELQDQPAFISVFNSYLPTHMRSLAALIQF